MDAPQNRHRWLITIALATGELKTCIMTGVSEFDLRRVIPQVVRESYGALLGASLIDLDDIQTTDSGAEMFRTLSM